jgi:hypothetical protein
VIYDRTNGYRLYLALTIPLAKVRTLRIGRLFTREEVADEELSWKRNS